MTWQLRRAEAADLGAIMLIEHAVFDTDAWSPAMMRSELRDRHGYYLVASPSQEPSRVDAYAGLRCPRGAPQADIQTIAVVPSARRSGLGRILMLRMIGEARGRGARELFLEVRADNPPAYELYETLGFERIALREKYYQPDGVDAIVMRLRIPDPEVAPA